MMASANRILSIITRLPGGAWRPSSSDRPLALLRCPDGIKGPRFFQKHAWKGINPHIEEIVDPEDKDGEKLLRIRDFDGLVALAQSAALEIHPWGTTTAHWEKPDMIIMDLDPSEDVAWSAVIMAAKEIKERFQALGLASFVKTSGGKGLHVVALSKPKATWPDVKAAAEAIADGMSADNPENISPSPQRRNGSATSSSTICAMAAATLPSRPIRRARGRGRRFRCHSHGTN